MEAIHPMLNFFTYVLAFITSECESKNMFSNSKFMNFDIFRTSPYGHSILSNTSFLISKWSSGIMIFYLLTLLCYHQIFQYLIFGKSYQKESQTYKYIYKDGHQNFTFLICLLWFSLNINFPFWISYYNPFGFSETLQICTKYINMANFPTVIFLFCYILLLYSFTYICFCQHFFS